MIIDQLPLLSGDVESTDEIPIERGTTTYKTTQAALVKSAADAAAAAQTTANAAQTAADAAQTTADGKAPINHASAATTYGVGNNANYGHVKLTDTPNASQQAGDGFAATPAAVQAAIDAVKWKPLWTNPNPSQNFDAQAITVDLSGYDALKFLVKSSAAGSAALYYDIPNSVGMYVLTGTYSNLTASGNVTFYNRTIKITSTGLDVEPSYGRVLNSTSAPPVANSTCIPWIVYGGNITT